MGKLVSKMAFQMEKAVLVHASLDKARGEFVDMWDACTVEERAAAYVMIGVEPAANALVGYGADAFDDLGT